MTGKEYVLSVLEQVEKRNSNEKEFLDAVIQMINRILSLIKKILKVYPTKINRI